MIEQCDRDRNFNENSIRQVSASEKEKHPENNLDIESETPNLILSVRATFFFLLFILKESLNMPAVYS